MSKTLRKQIEVAVERITDEGREEGAKRSAAHLYRVAQVGPSYPRKFTGVTDNQAIKQLRNLANKADAFVDALGKCSNFKAFSALEEVVKRDELTLARSVPNPLIRLEGEQPIILFSNEDWREIPRIASEAADELERGGNKRQGRKRDPYAMLISREVARTYEKATGKKPAKGYRDDSSKSGPFYRFLAEIFAILNIETVDAVTYTRWAAKKYQSDDMDGIAEK